MAGWVYILSNPAMTGLLKVGYTEIDPISRAKELSGSTGVAVPYEVEYQVYTTHPHQLEKEAHRNLKNHRVNKNREFFECRYEEAVEAIRYAANYLNDKSADFSIAHEISHKIAKEELEYKLKEKQKAREEEQRRRWQRAAEDRKRWEENERKRKEAEQQKVAEEQSRKDREKVEDRTRLVVEFENKKKKEIFLKKIFELSEHLSEREKYVYSRSFPLDDIELKNWVLNLKIDDSIVETYLKKHYPETLNGMRSYSIEKFDVPTLNDENKLLELEKIIENKLKKESEQKLRQKEQNRIRRQKELAERLENERITKEQKARLEHEKLERERIEKENFERIKLKKEQKIIKLKELLEKEKSDIKYSLIKYIPFKEVFSSIFICIFAAFLWYFDNNFKWISTIIFVVGLAGFYEIKCIIQCQKDYDLEQIDKEFQRQKNLIEKE